MAGLTPPPGWKLYFDGHNRPMFVNPLTGQSTPAGPQPPRTGSPASTNGSPSRTPPTQVMLPPGWEEARTPQGKVYYIDHNTKRTTWEPPAPYLPSSPPSSSSSSSSSSSPTSPSSSTSVYSNRPPAAMTSSPSIPLQPPSSGRGGVSIPGSAFAPPPSQGTSNISPYLYTSSPPSNYSSSLPPASSTSVYPSSSFTMQQPPSSQQQQLQTEPSFYPPSTREGGETRSRRVSDATALALSKPTWDSGKERPSCSQCGAEFSFFKRRHHCRCCFRQLCDPCTAQKHRVPQFGHEDTVRVCERCHDHLSKRDFRCMPRLVPYLKDGVDVPTKTRAMYEILELTNRDKQYCKDILVLGLLPALVEMLADAAPDIQILACKILTKLAEDSELYKDLLELNVIPAVIPLFFMENPEGRLEATKLLAHLARKDDHNKAAICEAGAILPLVHCLEDPSEPMREWSLMAIRFLGSLESNVYALLETDIISRLVDLLVPSSSFTTLEYATSTLELLSSYEKTRARILDIGGISALVGLLSAHPSVQAHALRSLVNFSRDEKGCVAIIEAKGVQALTAIISSSEDTPKEQIMDLLLKLSSISGHKQRVVEELLGGLALFIGLISSSNSFLKELALALILIMADNEQAKVLFNEAEGFTRLMSLLASGNDSHKQCCLAILSKLATNEENSIAIINSGVIRDIVALLSSSNPGIQLQATMVLSSLSQSDSISVGAIPAVISAVGGIVALLPLLNAPTSDVRAAACHTLANLCSSILCREGFYSAGGMRHISTLLSNAPDDPILREQGLRLLVTVCVDPKIRAAAGNCLPPLVSILSMLTRGGSAEESLLKQTLSVLLSFCKDSTANRQKVQEHGGLAPVLSLLRSENAEMQLIAAEIVSLLCAEEVARTEILEGEGSALSLLVDLLLSSNDPKLQQFVSKIISSLSFEEKHARMIYELGGIWAIVNLLRFEPHQSVDIQKNCLIAVANLSQFAMCREAIISAGGVSNVLDLLVTDTSCPATKQPAQATKEKTTTASSLRDHAMWALHILSFESTFSKALQTVKDGLERLISQLPKHKEANNRQHQLAVSTLVNLWEQDEQNENEEENHQWWYRFVEKAQIEGLLALVTSYNTSAQKRAARELSQLCSPYPLPITDSSLSAPEQEEKEKKDETTAQMESIEQAMKRSQAAQNAIFEGHAMIDLVALLSSPDQEVRESICGAISELSKHEKSWQPIIDYGGLDPIITLLSPSSIPSSPSDTSFTKSDKNSAVAFHRAIVAQYHCSLILYHMSSSGGEATLLDVLVRSGVVPTIVDFLRSFPLMMLHNNMKKEGEMIDNGMMSSSVITTRTRVLTAENCVRILSNLARDNHNNYLQRLHSSGVLHPLILMLVSLHENENDDASMEKDKVTSQSLVNTMEHIALCLEKMMHESTCRQTVLTDYDGSSFAAVTTKEEEALYSSPQQAHHRLRYQMKRSAFVLILAELLRHPNPTLRHAALHMSALLSTEEKFITQHPFAMLGYSTFNKNDKDAISSIEGGDLVTPLLNFLSVEEEAQEQDAEAAMRTLANMSGCPKFPQNNVILAQRGCIPPTIALLQRSINGNTRLACVELLANLSVDDDNKTMVCSGGAVPALIRCLKPEELAEHEEEKERVNDGDGAEALPTKVQYHAVRAISYLALSEESRIDIGKTHSGLAILTSILRTYRDSKLITICVWALDHLLLHEENKEAFLACPDGLSALLALLSSASFELSILSPVLELLRNLSNYEPVAKALEANDCSGIYSLVALLDSHSSDIVLLHTLEILQNAARTDKNRKVLKGCIGGALVGLKQKQTSPMVKNASFRLANTLGMVLALHHIL
ncbi:E3 ubiquitin-protein ligase nedd4 [Balamuthia mandrillaris]